MEGSTKIKSIIENYTQNFCLSIIQKKDTIVAPFLEELFKL